jgi:hypothetical protein
VPPATMVFAPPLVPRYALTSVGALVTAAGKEAEEEKTMPWLRRRRAKSLFIFLLP